MHKNRHNGHEMAINEQFTAGPSGAQKDIKTDRVVSPAAGQTDADPAENKLRPRDFSAYVGQTDVKENLRLFTRAAKGRDETLDHTLLHGPPGLGKTTLCMILAHEMGANLRQTAGPALEKPGDLAAILTNLNDGDFLFIDEIHRMRRPVEEVLYTAMEDFAIDLIVGKGPSARTMRLAVPRFTLLGATTLFSRLSSPLRDRFGHVARLRYYEPDEIKQILLRSAQILGVDITEPAAERLSHCSRCTPRIANRLIRRMRDFAQIDGQGTIDLSIVESSLGRLSIDPRGLDWSDQQYLKTLCETFHGGPVGLSTLAAALGEDESTIEEVIEPFLIREGMLSKTPRGRVASRAAWAHMGLKAPQKQGSLL